VKWTRTGIGEVSCIRSSPEGRKAVFVGDLVDRGPRVLDTVRIVRNMVEFGRRPVRPRQPRHEAAAKAARQECPDHARAGESLAEIDALPDDVREPFCKELADFLDGLVSHYVLDDGKLVVAHAGMKEELQGRGSGKVREFALYGETTGETDEFGLPVRYNWAAEYRGSAMVVYGHTPVPEPEWLNRTVNIDTGCVFGGKLTALRYPEKEFVSVPAKQTYCEPARPFLASASRPRCPPSNCTTTSSMPRMCWEADHLDSSATQRDHSGRERHGSAGSDEPVCRQPEVADLSAAHDVAVRNIE
jgi:protein phosphatase